MATDERIRPLSGLYRETSPSAEFLHADRLLRAGYVTPDDLRPNWASAWEDAGRPYLDSPAHAEALGASWYAQCDIEGNIVVTELTGVNSTGVTVALHTDDDLWHQAAVKWWISAFQDSSSVPVLWSKTGEEHAYPPDQAARGVSLHTAQDSLTVRTQEAGWAWVRVPWDPGWRSMTGSPVLKGGPGHLVVWAEKGETELRWSVPGLVDGTAAVASVAALTAATTLSVINRRRGFPTDIDHPGPVSDAIAVFADTVDGWWLGAIRKLREATGRTDKNLRYVLHETSGTRSAVIGSF